uniref:Bax inhibitor 1 n=1 Tax=Hemiselmis tepida TaxID=464990 RepID=A0A7S0YQH9_9CRYP
MHGGGYHGGFGGFANPFSRPMDWNALGKFDSITPAVQQHLMRVYACLSTGLMCLALGVYMDGKHHVSGTMTQVLLLGMIFALTMIKDLYNRLAIFHAVGLLMGCNLGPLVNQVAAFRPDIVMTAAMGTCTIFACFSAAAMVAKRREFLYLGGMLSSAISMLFAARFLNMIMGGALSSGLFAVELYGGLCMFMLYVVFDTQMIIEDAHNRRGDFVEHAMKLLTDFVAIFVRLLVILTQNAEKRERRERDKRR